MSNLLACSYNEKSREPSAAGEAAKTSRSQSRIEFREGVLLRAKDSRIGRSDEEGLRRRHKVSHVDEEDEGKGADIMRQVLGSPSLPALPISCE